MQRAANLPEINISPWEGNSFIRTALVVLLILFLITFFSTGFVKVIFILLILFVGTFIFSNLYGRFSANWRKLHYPLMCRYASVAGYVQGLSEKEGKEFDIDLTLQRLIQSVFPNVEEKIITNLVQEVISKEQQDLKDEKFIRKIFKRRLPELDEQNLSSLVHKITELNKNPTDTATTNYIKIRSIIAFLVEKKYGQEEKSDYLYAVLIDKAR